MPKFSDRAGQRYGNLVITKLHSRYARANGSSYYTWECLCDCGKTTIAITDNLVRGKTKSCGCQGSRNTIGVRTLTHGLSNTREYSVWGSMKKRCFNPNATHYKDYGGRGITVCDRWKDSFENFLKDMGKCPDGMTLDRIDNNGNYDPSNCRWTTQLVQARNSRHNRRFIVNGAVNTVSQLVKVLNTPRETIRRKLKALPNDSTLSDSFLCAMFDGYDKRSYQRAGCKTP